VRNGPGSTAAPASVATRSARALGWGLVGAVGKIAGQLVIQITLARLLGPLAFGQFAVIVAVLSLGNLFADGGFGSALVQKKDLAEHDISLAFGWTLLLSTIVVVALCVVAPLLAIQFDDPALTPMFRVGAIAIALNAMSNISWSLLSRELHQKSIQVIHIFGYIFGFGCVAILLALLGWNAWSLIIGYMVQTCVTLAAAYLMCRHTLRPRLGGDRSMMRFGLGVTASELSGWFVENFDRLVIGRFWGVLSLGYYSVAFNLSKAPIGQVMFNVRSIAFAAASRLQDELDTLRKGYVAGLSATLLATLPLFAIISLEASEILFLVYGQKWLSAAPYMTALALTVPAIALGSVTGAVLRGTGAVRIELMSLFAAGVVMFAGLLLLRHTALALAVWVVPLAYLTRLGLLAAALRRRLDMRSRDLLTPLGGALGLTASGLIVAVACRVLLEWGDCRVGILPLAAGLGVIATLLLIRLHWFAGAPLLATLRERSPSGRFGALVVWIARA
jgi:PST family polysaccharide transporter